MIVSKMILSKKVPRRQRVQATSLPSAAEIHHDLPGCDDGGSFALAVQSPQLPQLVSKQAQAQAGLLAPVSTVGAIQLLELRPEQRTARRAHHHRTSAVKAQVRVQC